eukprot:COSAG06_NODE_4044_length_4634_cov_9.897023_5_plen_171_part_00
MQETRTFCQDRLGTDRNMEKHKWKWHLAKTGSGQTDKTQMENGARLIPFFRFAYRGVYQSRPSGRLPDGRQCVRSGAADYPACCQSTCVTDAATPFVSVRLVCLSRACLGKALCSVSGKRRESKQTPRADFGCPHLVSLPRRVSRALPKTHTGRSLFLGAFPMFVPSLSW